MKLFSALFIAFLTFISTALSQEASQLPKALIIGDSISIAYTKPVTQALEGKILVKRVPGNAQYTGTGLQKIDEWLGTEKWDVIHFNWGLWDMYGWEFDAEDRSPETYAKRLDTLVTRLEKTGAKLIWATTTPACPDPEKTMQKRFQKAVIIDPAREKQYLVAAETVMKAHNVQINDLHALIAPHLEKYALGRNDVHFNNECSLLLAQQVAQKIAEALKVVPNPIPAPAK